MSKKRKKRHEIFNSLLQDEKVCYRTQSTINLHKHHIFAGSQRNKSEKYGLWVWLRNDWHNGASYSVHADPTGELAVHLKQEAQRKFEAIYGHEKFMEEFGKNYL